MSNLAENDFMEFEEQFEEQEENINILEALLDSRILRAIKEMGFEKMSPIQEQAIPPLLAGRDIIGQAQTGTGKTAAFGIPAIQKIDPDNRRLQTIVLCPTRELAIQAAEELKKIAKYMHGVKILPIYGGQEISKQINALRGVQMIVGTPGRVMDHMRRHTIKLDDVNMVVLDEADEMLNMGFREDMELILGQITADHQTALFSATMPKPILEITGRFQKDAELVKVAAKELTIPLVTQRFYKVRSQDKDAACVRLLEYYQPRLCLIFCNTKRKVDELAEYLKLNGYQAEGLHGDMSQHQRDVSMNRFRNGSTNILIATDVAARGIDVDDVEAVINYDIPQDIEYYVHRIGRTGRAGRSGRSFTFAAGRELYRIRDIERICHTTIEEKKLPGAGKVMKVKAEKLLNEACGIQESDDLEQMKKYVSLKMEEDDLSALDVAAMLLKQFVGDKGPEIETDDYKSRRYDRSRDGRGQDSRSRRGSTRPDDRRRGGRAGEGSYDDRRRSGRTGESSYDDRRRSGRTGESSYDDRRRSGRTGENSYNERSRKEGSYDNRSRDGQKAGAYRDGRRGDSRRTGGREEERAGVRTLPFTVRRKTADK